MGPKIKRKIDKPFRLCFLDPLVLVLLTSVSLLTATIVSLSSPSFGVVFDRGWRIERYFLPMRKEKI